MRNEIYSRVTSLLTQDSVLANWGDTSVNLVLKKKKLSVMSWLVRGLSSKLTQR